MTMVSIEAAGAKLAELIEEVEGGGEVFIFRGNVPVARLVPVPRPSGRRRFGSMRGQASVGPEFFEPLPEEELKRWE